MIPTIKKQLLLFLSIGQYFQFKKEAKRQQSQPLTDKWRGDSDENPAASIFRFNHSIQGLEYWMNVYYQSKRVDNVFTRLVKWFIRVVPFLMLVLIAGCKKDALIEPKEQKVYYVVQCKDCLITLESDKWNSDNDLDRSKNQSFNVTGSFKYSFVNNGRDSLKYSIYTSAFQPEQIIVARAFTNDGHTSDLSGRYGGEYPNEQQTTLKLK